MSSGADSTTVAPVLPTSDSEVEAAFLTLLADSAETLLKQSFSEAVTKTATGVILLSAVLLALALGFVTPDGLSVSPISVKIQGVKPLLVSLIGALIYLLWNLHLKVRNEDHINEYKRAVAVAKLSQALSAITSEVERLHGSGSLDVDGALRKKNVMIEELVAETAEAEKLKRRLTLVYPSAIAGIAVIFSAWFGLLQK